MENSKYYICVHCGVEVPFPPLAIEMWTTELSHHCISCHGLNKLYKGVVISKEYRREVVFNHTNISSILI